MRKLVLIIIAFIAAVTFIQAFSNSDHPLAGASEIIETY